MSRISGFVGLIKEYREGRSDREGEALATAGRAADAQLDLHLAKLRDRANSFDH